MNHEPHTDANHAQSRHGVVVNFFDFSEEQLTAMAHDLSLTMGKEELLLCQTYFKKPEPRFPTLDEIDFLDAIVRRRREFASAYRIGRTTAGHPHLSATREDLLQKLNAVSPRLSHPILLSEAADVAARYLDQIGVGKELVDTSKSKTSRPPLASGVVLLLLLPTDQKPYDEAVLSYLSDPLLLPKLIRRGSVTEYGLAVTLAREASGLHVDLSALGTEEHPEPLPSCLITDHIGSVWVAARPEAIELLLHAATAYGLLAVPFAKATSTGKLTLAKGAHPYMAPELALLLALAEGVYDGDCLLSSTDDRTAPFFGAIYDALAAVLLGSAAGNRRRELALSVVYQFPLFQTDPTSLGNDLEAILGVYRVLIELCVTAVSKTSFVPNQKNPAWNIEGYEPLHSLPDRRTCEDSTVYLITVTVDENGMPNFADMRLLCDALSRLAREGKILSAAMASNGTATAISPTAARAIFIESREPLPYSSVSRIDGELFFEARSILDKEPAENDFLPL